MTNRIPHLFRTRILPLAGLLLALAAIGYGARLLHQRQNRQTTEPEPGEAIPRPVKLVTVARIASRETATYPGTARASRNARLAFRVGGPLVEANVRLGDPVPAGALLMRIDPRDFAARVAGAESQLEAARARLDAMERGDRAEDIAVLDAKLEADRARLANARLDFDRARRLYADKVIPKADFDQAESAHSVAAANVVKLEQELAKARAGARAEDIAAARANIRGLETSLQTARDQLADTELRAPFAGVVVNQFAENHEMVAPGQTVLAMHAIDELEIVVNVPEIELVHETDWRRFQALARFPALPGRTFPASLKEFSTEADPSTRTYAVTFSLVPPKDANLLPGMTAEVSRRPRENAADVGDLLTVPAQAVLENGAGEPFVWVLPEGAERPQRRAVVCGGLAGSGDMLVRSGLEAGERVVVGGAHFISEHTPVRPLP